MRATRKRNDELFASLYRVISEISEWEHVLIEAVSEMRGERIESVHIGTKRSDHGQVTAFTEKRADGKQGFFAISFNDIGDFLESKRGTDDLTTDERLTRLEGLVRQMEGVAKI